jgi:hypothetical protein
MNASSAVLAGSLYFAVVFAAGFSLGMPRTLLLAPAVGELKAVLLELPVMLAIAWIACGWVLRKIEVPPDARQRVLVGATALVLLLAAEAALSIYLGKTLMEHFLSYTEPSALLGLAGQVAYACFPLLRRSPVSDRRAR